MAYIGRTPIVGNFQKCDAITVVNGQAAYTLQVSSTNVIPESVNHMIVSLNGVIQSPTTAYTVSGAVLTFDSNLATGDVIDFVILLGNVLDVGTPTDNTVATAKIQDDAVSTAKIADSAVSTAKIADDAITLAKMASGTDGQIITYDASGNPAAVGPGTDGQVLTSTGAGSPPAFEAISAGFTEGTQVATTSGSYIDFTSIPSGTKYIAIIWNNLGLSGTDDLVIQLGDSGGVETSGYSAAQGDGGGSQTVGTATNGLNIYLHNASRITLGIAEFHLMQSSSNTWHGKFFSYTDDWLDFGNCIKSLSGTLDRVRLETTGSNSFDAGTANIIYI